jgi:hypothetical protein
MVDMSLWIGHAVLVLAFLAMPCISVLIGYAARSGKPRNFRRDTYLTAFFSAITPSAFLMVWASRMQADVRTWRYPIQVTLFVAGIILMGIAGGCAIGVFAYRGVSSEAK